MKKLMLIINPAAGRGAYEKEIGKALNTLYNGGCLPSVYFTQAAGDAVRLAAEHAADYDIICCIGGDGTLSETVSGLMQTPKRPPIGYFPLGTTNDVATTLGLPKNDMPRAAAVICGGRTVDFDVGCFGEAEHFTYVAAFGAFTDVSYETPQEQKQALGHLAYVLEGMTRLPRLTSYHCFVSLDNGPEEEHSVLFGGVMNSTSVAGLVRLDTERVQLDDGLFEVVLVRNPRSVADFKQLLAEAKRSDFLQGEFLSVRQARSVRFRFDTPVPWTRDGESGGAFTEVTLRNSARAVQFMV